MMAKVPPKVSVSCGGWEGEVAVETGKAKSQENTRKRGAYPPSAARIVSQLFSSILFHSI